MSTQCTSRAMPFLLDDDDDELEESATWQVEEDGTLKHTPSGMMVSPDSGVVLNGAEYKICASDLEFDGDSILGSGACGVVQAAVHKPTGKRVAVKTVKVDNKEKREQMLHEIKGLVHAEGCPFLVQWFPGFVARDTGLVHVVVELMDLGSLADLRKRLGSEHVPTQQLACIASQLIRGLAHLQNKRLLHRDVKPANVLHNLRGQVKLTDFGISRDLASSLSIAATFVGTANYMAPERAIGNSYSYQSDVWSAGMVLYELATGKYPFSTKVFVELYDCICVRPEPRLDPEEFNPSLCDFVAKCLTRDAESRPDATSLRAHEFVCSPRAQETAVLAEWLSSLMA